MLKQEFLKKWLTGLQICSASKKEMNVVERKKAIKLSADMAMALTRNASTNWSRALIANASKENDNKTLVDQMLANHSDEKKIKKASIASLSRKKRAIRTSKRILKRSCGIRRVKKIAPRMSIASCIAKRLVKKRTQVLKRLVPGGESMDEFSLMEETLDYIVSLRAQVDVMRHLANSNIAHLNHK